MSWKDMYAKVTTPYGELGRFYDSLGHRGADYARKAGEPIYTYSACEIISIFRTDGLGQVITFKDADGYGAWAHTKTVLHPVGSQLSAGVQVASAAGVNDKPGTLWDGAHCHTTRSKISAYNAGWGIRPLQDPAPIINQFIKDFDSETASLTDATPITNGVDMAEMIVTVPDGRILHFLPGVKTTLSESEYTVWKSITDSYRATTPGATIAACPDYTELMGVDWTGYKHLCRHFGVSEN